MTAVIVSVVKVLRGCQGRIIKNKKRGGVLLQALNPAQLVSWSALCIVRMNSSFQAVRQEAVCTAQGGGGGEGGTLQIIAPLTLSWSNSYTASTEAQ